MHVGKRVAYMNNSSLPIPYDVSGRRREWQRMGGLLNLIQKNTHGNISLLTASIHIYREAELDL